MKEIKPKPETINHLFDAVHPSFALLAGLKLDLFTALEESALTAEEIAKKIKAQRRKIRPLLYILVNAGLLKYADGLFSNTAEAAQFLVKNKSSYLGKRLGLMAGNWRRMLQAAETIRNGKPDIAYDDPASTEDLEAVLRGLYPGAVEDGARLTNRFDFSDCEQLLDVGGGSGGLGITFAELYPDLKVTVLDLPSVTPITEKFVEEANLRDRVTVISANAVHAPLETQYDVVVARHLIQVLSEEDAQKLFENVAKMIKPGGRFLIVGYILDDSRLSPPKAVDFNLILITSVEHGEAYTESEYREWLEKAGFTGFDREVISNGSSIVSVNLPTST